jgi:hypothetical protein
MATPLTAGWSIIPALMDRNLKKWSVEELGIILCSPVKEKTSQSVL